MDVCENCDELHYEPVVCMECEKRGCVYCMPDELCRWCREAPEDDDDNDEGEEELMPNGASQRPVMTATTTEQVILTARQQERLLVELKEYAVIESQMQALKTELDAATARIEDIREDVGAKKVKFEGFGIARVEGEQKFYDWDFALREGWLTLAQIKQMTKRKPKKAYTGVTTPAQKARRKATDEDDE